MLNCPWVGVLATQCDILPGGNSHDNLQIKLWVNPDIGRDKALMSYVSMYKPIINGFSRSTSPARLPHLPSLPNSISCFHHHFTSSPREPCSSRPHCHCCSTSNRLDYCSNSFLFTNLAAPTIGNTNLGG